MKKLILMIGILAVAIGLKAQSSGTFQLKDSSFTKTFVFEVRQDSGPLKCYSESNLSKGSIEIRLVNPDGKSEGNYSLSTSKKESGAIEPAYGKIENKVEKPIAGSWKLVVSAEHATGKLKYEVSN
jgi:hypothetical protein